LQVRHRGLNDYTRVCHSADQKEIAVTDYRIAAADQTAAWCGLDVAKDSFEAALYLPHPQSAEPRSVASLACRGFDRTRQGVRLWLDWCDDQLAGFIHTTGYGRPPLRACMEATGRYSLELAAWITSARSAVEPAIIDPLAASHYAKSLRMRNKTDRVDAAVLARMGYERRFAPTAPMPPAYEKLRAMTRQRDFLTGELQRAKLRAAEIEAWPTMLAIHNQLIKDIKKAIKKIDRAINSHLAAETELAGAMARLRTIPGVGRLTAVVVLAELGDLRRFTTSRQVTSFAGMNPKLFDSGDSVHYAAHLSKQGPGRVRQALYMSAMSVLRMQTPLHQFYESLRKNEKTKMAALGAVMRKQLVLMRAVLIGQCDYDPGYVKPAPASAAQTCG
jgi:transposase